VAAHEAEAFIDDVEDAAGVVVAGTLGLALQDEIDEHVLAFALGGIELEVAGDLAELGDAHLAEVGDLEVVSLTGGFDLQLFFVFSDGSTASTSERGASAGASVAGTVALVGSGCGHMGKVTYG
jgi:hypothetical protein